MESAIIIGAKGFVGRTLASKIRSISSSCILFCLDIDFSNSNSSNPSEISNKNNNHHHHHYYFPCDIRDPIQVYTSFQNISTILQNLQISSKHVILFHVASYGMSSAEMVMRQQTYQVNVLGTQHIVETCKLFHFTYIVYTSTVNVVFGGQVIQNGKEEDFTSYYYPNHTDEYSKTKGIAEQYLLQQDPRIIKTVAIRSCAIYGIGEERHFPRIIQYFSQGFDRIQIGRQTYQDWIHVEDLVDAHIAAAMGLLSNPIIVQGQAYFVSEGYPCSTMEMMDPFRRRQKQQQQQQSKHTSTHDTQQDHPISSIHIPVWIAYILAFFLEYLFLFLYRLGLHRKGHDGGILAMLVQGPLMTRAEVNKVAITHYFSIEKIKRDLKWVPKVHPVKGREALYAYYKRKDL